jgi:hypothetical protein
MKTASNSQYKSNADGVQQERKGHSVWRREIIIRKLLPPSDIPIVELTAEVAGMASQT